MFDLTFTKAPYLLAEAEMCLRPNHRDLARAKEIMLILILRKAHYEGTVEDSYTQVDKDTMCLYEAWGDTFTGLLREVIESLGCECFGAERHPEDNVVIPPAPEGPVTRAEERRRVYLRTLKQQE